MTTPDNHATPVEGPARQRPLEHSSLTTMQRYLHVSSQHLGTVSGALDHRRHPVGVA
jgi:hypothetical protein